jgi:hypothetical protein
MNALAKIAEDFLIGTVYSPLSSTAYGIIGFYFTSSIFRSFRGRNSYVAVFLLSGIILILYGSPVQSFIPGLKEAGLWVLNVPNLAGTRGIVIGASVGFIAASIRAIFGMERAGLLTEAK